MDKKSKKDTVTLEKEGKRKKEEDVKQDQKENEVATNNKLEKPEQWIERMYDSEKFQSM